MSNNSTMYDRATQVIVSHHPIDGLTVSPLLIRILGSSSAVIFAMLLRYAAQNYDGWFAKSHRELADELGLSVAVVRRCIHGHPNAPHKITLNEFGVDVMVAKRNGAPTTHYRINRERINKFMMDYDDAINEVNKDNVRRVWGEKYVQQMWGADNVE